MQGKQVSLEDAVNMLASGSLLALGGNTLHRAPMAFVRQCVRQGVNHLRLVKTAGAHEIDLLCAAGAVETVDAGFVSYETKYGLAGFYRKAVERGEVKANEHACYTVICALRAAATGAPFMPVRGIVYSDLLKVNPLFSVVEDPFGSGPVAVVKAIRPDVAVIHAQKCDVLGNTIIEGSRFEDELLVRAAKKVIVTSETILPAGSSEIRPDKVTIPGFLVSAVVHVPGGAKPCACYGKYAPDGNDIRQFQALKSKEELGKYLAKFEAGDHGKRRMGYGT